MERYMAGYGTVSIYYLQCIRLVLGEIAVVAFGSSLSIFAGFNIIQLEGL
jgi:hypothetical protein